MGPCNMVKVYVLVALAIGVGLATRTRLMRRGTNETKERALTAQETNRARVAYGYLNSQHDMAQDAV